MRRLIILGLAACTALPVLAARRVTVSQLEQALSSAVAKHRSDADIARGLVDVQLSERLTDRTRDRLIANFALQANAALALGLLADESAPLDPPKSELPATLPPDQAAQQQMLQAAGAYVLQTIPRLPNFFATRTTVRFDDSAQVVHAGEWPVRAGFHLVGNAQRTVTMRDGQEVTDSPQQVSSRPEQVMGLYSFGEFGPILARTLADLAKGKIQFSHWEDTPLGVVAVFHYSVPRHESHYQVHFCCLLGQEYLGGQSTHNRNMPRYHSGNQNPVETTGLQAWDATPPYHGTLSIDPATGAILRMTLEAELDPDNTVTRASTVVEYGRIEIGEQTFICPVRSLAISSQQGPPPAGEAIQRVPLLSINETTFTQYHRLGSSARLIASGPVPDTAAPGPPQEPPPPVTNADTPAASKTPAISETPQQPSTGKLVADAARPVSSPLADAAAIRTEPARPAAAAEPPDPEISVSEPGALPDTPAAPIPANNDAALKTTSRLIDVTVVAFDKKGHPVTDLKAGDFELLDDGKKEENQFSAPADVLQHPASSAADAAPSGRTFSNRPTDTSVETSSTAHSGGTVLLVDESLTESSDPSSLRSQILKFLSALPAEERVGLYTMNGAGFQPVVELTSDRAPVVDRVNALMAAAQAAERNHDESGPDVNSARTRFLVLEQVARHLASIPGHKNLAWFSNESQNSNPRKGQPATDPRLLAALTRLAQEAMNEAHTSVYPVGQSPADSPGTTPDQASSALDLAAASASAAQAASSAGAAGGSGSVRRSHDGSSAAQTQTQAASELRAFQAAYRELAEGTGGHAIPQSSDLANALTLMVQEGRSTYRLSFVPRVPADDRYHVIAVRLTSRRGITLRHRAGYLCEQEPPTLKERFQSAVWRPSDSIGIALSATITDAASAGNTIRLKIAAADLGMRQQAGRWMDKLAIFLIQRDDAGRRSHVDSQAVAMRLKPETYQSSMSAGIPFEHPIEMQPGMSSVRILVVDSNSGRIGSVTIPSSALQPVGQAAVSTPQAGTP